MPSTTTSYRDLLERIAEECPNGLDSLRDLPELSLDDLAAALKHYPAAFVEAIADADPDLGAMITERLGDTTQKVTERYAKIGLVIVGSIRAYLKSIVARDAQQEIERQRELVAHPAESLS